MLREEHGSSDMFVRYVVERHNRAQADLVNQLFNSSEQRLARALLILSRVGKKDKTETVIPKVSQETLAEMVGTSEFLQEQVQKTWLHRLRQRAGGK